MAIHFSLLLIEPEGINYQLLKVILSEDTYNLHHLSSFSKAWNHIQTHHAPDIIIINSEFPSDQMFNISIEELLTLLAENKAWNNVPKMLLLEKDKRSLSSFLKAHPVDSTIHLPFNPIDFVNNIYYLLELGLQRHIKELNQQHLNLGKFFKQLLKEILEKKSFLTLFKKMEQLHTMIQAHFLFEENYMKHHNYDDFADHHKHHQQVLIFMKQTLEKMSLMDHKKLHDKVAKLQADLSGDINDDASYIQFIEAARNNLTVSIKDK